MTPSTATRPAEAPARRRRFERRTRPRSRWIPPSLRAPALVRDQVPERPEIEPKEPLVEGAGGQRARARDALFRRALAVADLVAAAFGIGVALLLLGGESPKPALAIALPLVVLVSKVVGLYDRDELVLRRTTLEESPALFHAATAYSLIVWVCSKPLVGASLGHGETVVLWALMFCSMVLARATARRVAFRFATVERCLVLGDAPTAERLRWSFRATRQVKAVVVGHVPLDSAAANGRGRPRDGALAELRAVLEGGEIDRVIIVPRRTDSERMVQAVRVVKGLGVKVGVLPRLFEVVGSSAAVDDLDGLMLLGLRPEGLTRSSKLLKRSIDLVGATLALVALAPVLAVAALVRLTSPGPMLERQRCVGLGGRVFEMLGFRSRPGDALRRLPVVEAPQLVNVLRGEMSLVGPRPVPPAADDATGDSAPGSPLSDDVGLRPGITGLWRTRGAAESRAEELVKLDYLYAANWSVWVDIRLLLRTIAAFRHRPPAAAAARTAAPLPPGEVGGMRLNGGVAERAPSGNGTAPAEQARSAIPSLRQARARQLTVSTIVPATNSPATLDDCLRGLSEARDGPDEVVVVRECARPGVAAARNEGASRATGDILVFVDADVVVHPDAFIRIREAFEGDPEVAAVFGSYDDGIATFGSVATFRNLLHHHIHQSCPGTAGTFWSGLGAVRREDFQACGGFDAKRYEAPSVEDIDLGIRLRARGGRILLKPKIQGTHLKDWGLWEMVHTDFVRRGVPWIVLLLRSRGAASTTLNLSWKHRLSAACSFVALCALVVRRPSVAFAAALSFLGLNSPFYLLLARRHGIRTSAAGVGLHVLHHLTSIAAVPVGVLAHLVEWRAGSRGAWR